MRGFSLGLIRFVWFVSGIGGSRGMGLGKLGGRSVLGGREMGVLRIKRRVIEVLLEEVLIYGFEISCFRFYILLDRK